MVRCSNFTVVTIVGKISYEDKTPVQTLCQLGFFGQSYCKIFYKDVLGLNNVELGS